MILAVDIDGTIVDSNSLVYKVLNNFPVKILGISKSSSKIFDASKTYKKTVLNKIFSCLNPKSFDVFESAVDVINHLQKENIVILLSSRPSKFKSIMYLTQQNLQNANIHSDLIIFGVKDKAKFCKDYAVDIFVDNNIVTSKKIAATKTKSICVNSNVSQSDQQNVFVCDDWAQVFLCIKLFGFSKTKNKEREIANIKAQFDASNALQK